MSITTEVRAYTVAGDDHTHTLDPAVDPERTLLLPGWSVDSSLTDRALARHNIRDLGDGIRTRRFSSGAETFLMRAHLLHLPVGYFVEHGEVTIPGDAGGLDHEHTLAAATTPGRRMLLVSREGVTSGIAARFSAVDKIHFKTTTRQTDSAVVNYQVVHLPEGADVIEMARIEQSQAGGPQSFPIGQTVDPTDYFPILHDHHDSGALVRMFSRVRINAAGTDIEWEVGQTTSFNRILDFQLVHLPGAKVEVVALQMADAVTASAEVSHGGVDVGQAFPFAAGYVNTTGMLNATVGHGDALVRLLLSATDVQALRGEATGQWDNWVHIVHFSAASGPTPAHQFTISRPLG